MTTTQVLLSGTAAWLLAGIAPASAQVSPPAVGEAAAQPGAAAAPADSTKNSAPERQRTSTGPRQSGRRGTYAPTGSGEASSQEQLTQNSQVAPSRFLLRDKPVPVFPNPYPAAARGDRRVHPAHGRGHSGYGSRRNRHRRRGRAHSASAREAPGHPYRRLRAWGELGGTPSPPLGVRLRPCRLGRDP